MTEGRNSWEERAVGKLPKGKKKIEMVITKSCVWKQKRKEKKGLSKGVEDLFFFLFFFLLPYRHSLCMYLLPLQNALVSFFLLVWCPPPPPPNNDRGGSHPIPSRPGPGQTQALSLTQASSFLEETFGIWCMLISYLPNLLTLDTYSCWTT
ncbi:hypothetical protein DM02DRAFT_342377 [Periconia macrospinosa]|uniref:Uncharacterized protein n=1 Tax=Periconia macrospinosa TaxID=97972 RepID=A0A2V1D1T7_9PLEO|nr:hypothetical protein DM02DRAFT_342377 [Periconia macrospinosa]